jgi:hypothetical protein
VITVSMNVQLNTSNRKGTSTPVEPSWVKFQSTTSAHWWALILEILKIKSKINAPNPARRLIFNKCANIRMGLFI